MRIIIAPDSFKGSLTAAEVAASIERGVKKSYPRQKPSLFPWPTAVKALWTPWFLPRGAGLSQRR